MTDKGREKDRKSEQVSEREIEIDRERRNQRDICNGPGF